MDALTVEADESNTADENEQGSDEYNSDSTYENVSSCESELDHNIFFSDDFEYEDVFYEISSVEAVEAPALVIQVEGRELQEKFKKLNDTYEDLHKTALKILTSKFSQPQFFLQAEPKTDAVSRLQQDISASQSLMDLHLPHSPIATSQPPSQIAPLPINSPGYYTTISKRKLKMLEGSHQVMTGLKQKLKKKKYTGSELSERLYATALAHAPGVSFPAAEILISAAIRAFTHDFGLEVEGLNELIPKSCVPSQSKLTEMINMLSAKFISEMAHEVKEAGAVYYACDKGCKRGVQHFVKYVCLWCIKEKKVKTPLLDIDAAGGSSVDAAAAFDESMKKIDLPQFSHRSRLAGGCSDAGGGGTGLSLDSNLTERDRMKTDYISATCCIHGHSLTLSNPIIKALLFKK